MLVLRTLVEGKERGAYGIAGELDDGVCISRLADT
jgi:hypothetical protein